MKAGVLHSVRESFANSVSNNANVVACSEPLQHLAKIYAYKFKSGKLLSKSALNLVLRVTTQRVNFYKRYSMKRYLKKYI